MASFTSLQPLSNPSTVGPRWASCCQSTPSYSYHQQLLKMALNTSVGRCHYKGIQLTTFLPVATRNSSSSRPTRSRSYVLLPQDSMTTAMAMGATQCIHRRGRSAHVYGAFALSDYRLLLVSLPIVKYSATADANGLVEAMGLKEDLLRGIYAYSG